LTFVRTSQDQKSQVHDLGDVACVLTASGEKTSECLKEMVTFTLIIKFTIETVLEGTLKHYILLPWDKQLQM
jgi:hypothetical protein